MMELRDVHITDGVVVIMKPVRLVRSSIKNCKIQLNGEACFINDSKASGTVLDCIG